MGEMSFGGEAEQPVVEVAPIKTKTLGEGGSTGWENETTFTAEEVVKALKEINPAVGDVKVIEQMVSHEGVLLRVDLRAPGSTSGYSYMLKGKHGPRNGSKVTKIERIDYAGPDSEDVEYAEIVAEYQNDAWVKKT